jgi:hypothetical protein
MTSVFGDQLLDKRLMRLVQDLSAKLHCLLLQTLNEWSQRKGDIAS